MKAGEEGRGHTSAPQKHSLIGSNKCLQYTGPQKTWHRQECPINVHGSMQNISRVHDHEYKALGRRR